jgi:G:T-mismatch repair DNA endonuclease (very short patch repair protein)
MNIRRSLNEAGWAVHVVWECQTRNADDLEALARMVLSMPVATVNRRRRHASNSD